MARVTTRRGDVELDSRQDDHPTLFFFRFALVPCGLRYVRSVGQASRPSLELQTHNFTKPCITERVICTA